MSVTSVVDAGMAADGAGGLGDGSEQDVIVSLIAKLRRRLLAEYPKALAAPPSEAFHAFYSTDDAHAASHDFVELVRALHHHVTRCAADMRACCCALNRVQGAEAPSVEALAARWAFARPVDPLAEEWPPRMVLRPEALPDELKAS
jgi:hypothetical protein